MDLFLGIIERKLIGAESKGIWYFRGCPPESPMAITIFATIVFRCDMLLLLGPLGLQLLLSGFVLCFKNFSLPMTDKIYFIVGIIKMRHQHCSFVHRSYNTG
ncbi:hypothetical protein CK203_115764 [Vitis vinifera]|uniref:Uncharacterized protein n=1 Tax=Vitis vinifera TaxID=29760 RepID=A0A438CAE9_VITVI|nr:hypothetical protein CK203_115764 [Vitis vinifera]